MNLLTHISQIAKWTCWRIFPRSPNEHFDTYSPDHQMNLLTHISQIAKWTFWYIFPRSPQAWDSSTARGSSTWTWNLRTWCWPPRSWTTSASRSSTLAWPGGSSRQDTSGVSGGGSGGGRGGQQVLHRWRKALVIEPDLELQIFFSAEVATCVINWTVELFKKFSINLNTFWSLIWS